MNTGYIYAHKNKINNMMYIGQSAKDIGERWGINGSSYLRLNDKGNFRHPKFANAIIKYGWESFEHLILEENIPFDELNDKETYYITLYDSCKNGYNCNYGGEYICTNTSKIIYQYDLSGNFIQKFESVILAGKYINSLNQDMKISKNIASHISTAAINKTVSYGYQWRHDFFEKLEPANYSGIPIKIILIDNDFRKPFDSLTDAAKYIKQIYHKTSQITSIISNIRRAIASNKKMYGYNWEYFSPTTTE